MSCIAELSKELVEAEQNLQIYGMVNAYDRKPEDLIQIRVNYSNAQIRYNKARVALDEFINKESK